MSGSAFNIDDFLVHFPIAPTNSNNSRHLHPYNNNNNHAIPQQYHLEHHSPPGTPPKVPAQPSHPESMLMALASGPETHYLMPMPLPLHVAVDTRFSPDAHASAPVSPVDNGALSWMMDMGASSSSRHESLSTPSLNFQLHQMQQLQRMQEPNQHLGLVLGAQQQQQQHHQQQQRQQQQLFQKSAFLQQAGYQAQPDQSHYPRLTGAQYALYQPPLHPFTPSIPSTSSAVEFRGIASSSSRGASSPNFQPTNTPSHQQASIPLSIHPNNNNNNNSLRQSDASPSTTAHSDTNSPEQSDEQEFSPSPSGNDYESIFTRYLAVMSNSNASTTTTSNTTSSTYPNTATGQSSTPLEAKTYLRRPIQKDHKNILKRLFKKDPSPLPAQVRWIANELGIEKNKVKVWFQNQRAQLKRRQNVIALRPSKSI
ncbi:hypothetical protein HDU77_011668 [Chytriomyces hyalinus]|nr:hypothetical protein HDU77_011668 [Chytriomyces hyalinus]